MKSRRPDLYTAMQAAEAPRTSQIRTWRSGDPYGPKNTTPEPRPAPRVHRLIDCDLIGGPLDGRRITLKADEYNMPPPTLSVVSDQPRAVYRHLPGTREFRWWVAPPGTPVPPSVPINPAKLV